MSKSRLTKEQKEQKEAELREKKRLEEIKKLPVATLNDLISDDLRWKESGIIMKNGSNFKVKYRRLDFNEYNTVLPKEPEGFDERVEYFKKLILVSSVEPKFESIEEVEKLDIGLITDLGRQIDSYLFEERFL